MGFQLVIAEGKEAGKEFLFDQASVVIGRTPECDVILYDPGVSRKHARIFSEGASYFVEDMGSSNGTKVNGSVITKKALKDGDAVALGPVVFSFSSTASDENTDGGAGEISNDATRIVAVDAVKQRNRGVALAPPDSNPEELAKLARTSTATMSALRRRSTGGSPVVVERTGGAGLSAADRARIRRESSAMGARARIFWAEASTVTRRVLLGSGIGVGLLGLGFLYYLVLGPGDGVSKPPEPVLLGRNPISYSFGLGEGVDYVRPDMKVFDFEFNAPVKAVVIIHFQSKDISQGEVIVSVNGADVGAIPPDTMAAHERSHEIIVPPSRLKKGERNKVIFDNTQNPPKADAWRIWNIWVEVNLLPELEPAELLREAKVLFERGLVRLDRREVGAINRYEAWKDFRTAWLMLEAHPEPKPELYELSRAKVKEAQQELDRICAKLLLEAESFYNQNQFDSARATLEHVRSYFPGNDQPCSWRADQKRRDYDL